MSSSRPSSVRSLDFTAATKPKVRPESSKKSSTEIKQEGHIASPTWADRVKGVNSAVVKPHPLTVEGKKDGPLHRASEGGVDEDGWETVSRGRVRSAGAGGRPLRTSSHPSKPGELASSPVSPVGPGGSGRGGGSGTSSKQLSPTKGRKEEATSTRDSSNMIEGGGKVESGGGSVEEKEERGEALKEKEDKSLEQGGSDGTRQANELCDVASAEKMPDGGVASKGAQSDGSGVEKEKLSTEALAVEGQSQEDKKDEEADEVC